MTLARKAIEDGIGGGVLAWASLGALLTRDGAAFAADQQILALAGGFIIGASFKAIFR